MSSMRYAYFLLPLSLVLCGCDAKKEEDHSMLDEMVLLEKEEEDAPLVTDSAELTPQEIVGRNDEL